MGTNLVVEDLDTRLCSNNCQSQENRLSQTNLKRLIILKKDESRISMGARNAESFSLSYLIHLPFKPFRTDKWKFEKGETPFENAG